MEQQFYIKIWGSRGSIPTPGKSTVKYGGDTSCIEVRCGNVLFILDCGTGLRSLGQSLLKEMPINATILLTHAHWDHIQGFPFFVPAYIPGNSFHIYAPKRIDVENTLRNQMSAPNFPITLDDMNANFKFTEIGNKGKIEIKDINIQYDSLNHPGGVTSYRFNYLNKSFVYATDTEHFSCLDPVLLKLADSADILVYDACYTNEEYCNPASSRTGWGHSTWETGVDIAMTANVKQLILFHHDPSHTDDKIDEIEKEAQKLFSNTNAAYDGMEIQLV